MTIRILNGFCLSLLATAAIYSCGEIESPVTEEIPKTYKISVKATKAESPLTRALDITTDGDGKHVLNSSWETTDVIYVWKGTESDAPLIGTLKPKSDGASAILEGEITGGPFWTTTTLVFTNLGNGESPSCDYTGQDGTLEGLARNHDYIYATAHPKHYSEDEVLLDPLTFVPRQAVVKFILKDSDNTPVCPDRLELSAYDVSNNSMLYTTDNTLGTLVVDIDQRGEPTNEVYVAIRQYSDASLFQINAYKAGFKYIKQRKTSSEPYTYFQTGKYYEVNVNMGTPEADPLFTLDSFSFDFDFGESAREWPVFVFFDGITTGYWHDADGSGSGAGSFVNLGGTSAVDLAAVRKVTAVSMPHWTNQTIVYADGKWTFGGIEGWEYIADSKVGCEYSLVDGHPNLSAKINLAAPEVTGKEIRVYNNATNAKVAYNNLIPMGLASISSDGTVSEVGEDPGGWISLVRSSDPESTTTYGYAREVASPASFAYLALERNSGGSKTYYHQFMTSSASALNDYTGAEGAYSVVQDNNGLDWIQVGKDHYATVGGMTWWTTNLAADRSNPEPHPWTAAALSWAQETDNQFGADRNTRSLSEATFYGTSELPSINSDAPNYRTFFTATSAYHLKLRVCGVNGVIMAENAAPANFIFLAVPDREDYEFVYYYNSWVDYIVYRANDYYWAKEYDPNQASQTFYYDGSHGAGYWNLYRTSAININFQEPGGSYVPPYRFPYPDTGADGYGLPDFGCSAEPIEGRLQPVRVYLPARPVKK